MRPPSRTLLFALRFRGRFRAGRGGEDAGLSFPSDTLFGALCHAGAACWGPDALRALLDRCLGGQPPFRFTSAFPFVVDGRREVFLLPRPHRPPPGFEDPALREGHARGVKGLRFVPRDAFRAWVAGRAPDYGACLEVDRLLSEQFRLDLAPHVALGRADAQPDYHQVASVWVRQGAGLYLLAAFEDAGWVEPFVAALRWLGDGGIGGRRGRGMGQFEVAVRDVGEDADWRGFGPVPQGTGCLLSRLAPEPRSATSLLTAGYELVEAGGWAMSEAGQARHRRVWMLAEGSVLPRWDPGRLVEVTPRGWQGHPVYRWGFGFAFGAGEAG